MTKESKDSLTRIGTILGALVAFFALIAAGKATGESWLTPRREFESYVQSKALRDSLFQARVMRWMKYDICERARKPAESCLDPERP